MLNSNFDLRTFLTESKASTEQIQEATLTEATVMEYIRERMSSMNNEVRSCMREYLERCNEIDMEHDDAHAQLMNALEDFYNKLKAHFEEDAAAEDLPMDTEVPAAPVGTIGDEPLEEGESESLYKIQTTTPNSDPTIQKLSDRAAKDLEKSMDIVSIELVKEVEDEDFGGEEDELDEVKVKVSIPGQDSFEAEEGKEYSEEEADEYIENAKDSGATPMNTEFEKVSEDHSANPNDKYVVRPCKNKKEPWAVWEGEVRVKGFATKEEAQAYADKQNKEQGLNELDSKEALWPLPEEWYSKYYTVDFYADGPRFFNNETGEEVSYKDISAHYEKEAEDYSNTVNEDLKEETLNVVSEGLDPETVDLLMGLAKTAVNMGTVPAALAILYQFKDHPKIAKVVTAFEKHLDK